MSDQAGAYATRFELLAQLSHWRQRRMPERGLNQRIDPHIVPNNIFQASCWMAVCHNVECSWCRPFINLVAGGLRLLR